MQPLVIATFGSRKTACYMRPLSLCKQTKIRGKPCEQPDEEDNDDEFCEKGEAEPHIPRRQRVKKTVKLLAHFIRPPLLLPAVPPNPCITSEEGNVWPGFVGN